MKYIRTKDGRIIDLEQGWNCFDLYDGSKELKKHYSRMVFNQRGDAMFTSEEYFTSLDILKQADTIEELCDEFVLFREGKPYAFVPNKEYNAKIAHDCWKDYRGAIWTDKGLIYVAKMNEKGDLELL